MAYCLMLFRPPPDQEALATARRLWAGSDDDESAAAVFAEDERERLARALAESDPRLRSSYDDGVWELEAPHAGDSVKLEVAADAVLAYLPETEPQIERALHTLRQLAGDFGLATYDAERDALVDLDDDGTAALRRSVLDELVTQHAVADTNIDSIRGGTIGMLVTILLLAGIAFALARPEYRAQVIAAVPIVVIVATIVRLLLVRRRLRKQNPAP